MREQSIRIRSYTERRERERNIYISFNDSDSDSGYRRGDSYVSVSHLERAEEEVKEELDVAQGALGVLIGDKGKNHLMDPQQWNQRQC